MARSVADAAVLLSAISGADADDRALVSLVKAGDTEAPSAPADLSAQAPSPDRVSLSWSAATAPVASVPPSMMLASSSTRSVDSTRDTQPWVSLKAAIAGWERQQRFDHFGEITAERLARLGRQLDLSAIAGREAAEAVPLGFVLPALTVRQLRGEQGFHRRWRLRVGHRW